MGDFCNAVVEFQRGVFVADRATTSSLMRGESKGDWPYDETLGCQPYVFNLRLYKCTDK